MESAVVAERANLFNALDVHGHACSAAEAAGEDFDEDDTALQKEKHGETLANLDLTTLTPGEMAILVAALCAPPNWLIEDLLDRLYTPQEHCGQFGYGGNYYCRTTARESWVKYVHSRGMDALLEEKERDAHAAGNDDGVFDSDDEDPPECYLEYEGIDCPACRDWGVDPDWSAGLECGYCLRCQVYSSEWRGGCGANYTSSFAMPDYMYCPGCLVDLLVNGSKVCLHCYEEFSGPQCPYPMDDTLRDAARVVWNEDPQTVVIRAMAKAWHEYQGTPPPPALSPAKKTKEQEQEQRVRDLARLLGLRRLGRVRGDYEVVEPFGAAVIRLL